MFSLVPMAALSPKMRSTAVSVFVVEVEAGKDRKNHNKSATLNLEALMMESLTENSSAILGMSDSSSNLLECGVNNKD